jgi:hypothetical protein
MLVLGSHGHGAFYNLIVGSVAAGVIRNSKVPVLVVPSHAAEKVRPKEHAEAEDNAVPVQGMHAGV